MGRDRSRRDAGFAEYDDLSRATRHGVGPRIAHAILPIPGKGGSNWGYSWITVVGPLVGAAVAAITYQVFFTDLATKVIAP